MKGKHTGNPLLYGNTEGCPIGEKLFTDWKDDEIHKKRNDNDEDS